MRITNKLQDFIEKYPDDWHDRLSSDPYNLKIRQHPTIKHRYIFTYDMIHSLMSDEIVKIARGIVIDVLDTRLERWDFSGDEIFRPIFMTKIVARAFDKFFNYGEGNAAAIDWNGKIFAREKLDGSIIKYTVENGEDLWMTNNGFNADANLPCDLNDFVDGIDTFKDLIDLAMDNFTKEEKSIMQMFGTAATFIFELTSPYNRIVVPYKETELTLIGIRDNNSQNEINIEEFLAEHENFPQFKTPKVYELTAKSLDEVVEIVASLDSNHEGIIIQDEHFNRVKVKSEQYLSIHRMKDNNGQLSVEHLLKCIQAGTIDDVMGIFPEYAEIIDKVVEKYKTVETLVHETLADAYSIKLFAQSTNDAAANKKTFALAVKDKPLAKLYFEVYKGTDSETIKNKFLAKLDYEQMEKLCQQKS